MTSGINPHLLLRAGAGDTLDLRRRLAGFPGDVSILFDQEAVRRLIAVDAAGQRARHLAVRALCAVFVDDVEHDELGIQSRLSRHGMTRCFLLLAPDRNEKAGASMTPAPL